ncbi:WAT1-related protein, partial [Mucuna pruriens]
MRVLRNLLEWTPFAAMLVIECLDVALTTLSKAAMSKGMNHFVFVVYSNTLATLILLPFSFFIHRYLLSHFLINTTLFHFSFLIPSLPSSLFAEQPHHPFLSPFYASSSFSPFLGIITVMQNCVFTGIDYSSPTLGSAMSNLTPAITFVLAVSLGMEKLNTGSSISQIKVMGTVLSISGALLVTLYKGSSITSLRIQPSAPSQPLPSLLAETSNWVIGGIFLAIASVSLAAWNITQATILKGYSSQLTIVAFYC